MGMGTGDNDAGCSVCHADYHNPYASEWRESAHAAGHEAEGAADNAACTPCHTAEGFIDTHVRRTGAETYGDDSMPLTCVVCHDPHDPTNPGMIREAHADLLCTKCHTIEDELLADKPHHPQTDVLDGTGAHEYANMVYPDSPHRVEAPDLCATCHLTKKPYEGPGSPSYTYHDFAARPSTCTQCHNDAEGASELEDLDFLVDARTVIDSLANELDLILEAVPDTTDGYRDALYNLEYVREDGSRGAHNYLYTKAVLETTIEMFVPGK